MEATTDGPCRSSFYLILNVLLLIFCKAYSFSDSGDIICEIGYCLGPYRNYWFGCVFKFNGWSSFNLGRLETILVFGKGGFRESKFSDRVLNLGLFKELVSVSSKLLDTGFNTPSWLNSLLVFLWISKPLGLDLGIVFCINSLFTLARLSNS